MVRDALPGMTYRGRAIVLSSHDVCRVVCLQYLYHTCLWDDGTLHPVHRQEIGMSTLEERLSRLEAAEAIRALKGGYFISCDRKDPRGFRAAFADGKVHIDYGVVGVFDNADALTQVFSEVGCKPHMVEMHHGVSQQIDVLSDSHARAVWGLTYNLIDTEAKKLTQLGGYYEDEYCKQEGQWKICRTKFVVNSTLVLDLTSDNVKPVFAGRPG